MDEPNKFKFTQASVDRLLEIPPDKRARRYYDTDTRGFYISYSKAGTPSYMLRYTGVGGGKREMSLGEVELVPLTMARSSAREKIANLAVLQVDPLEVKKQMREEAKKPKLETFGDLARAFLAAMESRRSVERHVAETRHLNIYVLPAIGTVPIEKLTKQRVIDLVHDIKTGIVERKKRKKRKGANSKTTANLCHQTIKRILRWAVDSDLATRNVADFKVVFSNTPPKRIGRPTKNASQRSGTTPFGKLSATSVVASTASWRSCCIWQPSSVRLTSVGLSGRILIWTLNSGRSRPSTTRPARRRVSPITSS